MSLLNRLKLNSLLRYCSSSSSSPYKSSIAVENLYPSQSHFLDRYSSLESPASKSGSFSGWIPMESLSWTEDPKSFRVSISFDPKTADWLPQEAGLIPGRDGLIHVSSNRTRSSLLNRADVLQKLRAAIRESIAPPSSPRPIQEKEFESRRKALMKSAREKLILPSNQSSSIFSDESNLNTI
eukprot:TRINITY_DN7250_c0_g1_i1.p1 TRINITY_DN7250_c0_g1~~TRINITY_DN7250_c0_g1_i1.p1  ORF type:complete len:182 (+),score=30.61 TRINITY_DN7250_c0_g1_i1:57-602(+)